MKPAINIKIFIFVGILAMLFAGLFALAIYPFFSEIEKNSLELVIQKDRLVQLEEEAEALKRGEALYNSQTENIAKIDTLLVNADLPTEFMAFIEDSAAKSGVKIEISSAFSPRPEPGTWSGIGFQVSVNGPFPNCLRFIDRLEASPYLIDILNFNVNSSSGGRYVAEQTETTSSPQPLPAVIKNVDAIVLLKAFIR